MCDSENTFFQSPAKVRAERTPSGGLMDNQRRSKSSPTGHSDSGTYSSNSDSSSENPKGHPKVMFAQSVTPTPGDRRQSLIHGVSDDELASASLEDLRLKQRQQRHYQVWPLTQIFSVSFLYKINDHL